MKRPPLPPPKPTTLSRSSLLIDTEFDRVLTELRERADDAGYELDEHGLCEACDAKLTEADVDNGACTQCGCELRVKTGEEE